MRTNLQAKPDPVFTHEGAQAVRLSPLRHLRRMTLAALLWENTFYEKGSSLAAQVATLVPQCDPEAVMLLAIECRNKMYLRHMPLFLLRELAKIKGCGKYVHIGLSLCIQRADEMGEYLALYFKDDPKIPLSAGSKRGLGEVFKGFSAYDLAKYDSEKAAFKLKDILRLVHPKPKDEEQSLMWRSLIAGGLKGTADTWENELSRGADKKATFERLIQEKKLGGLAFLRNLRNMIESGVDPDLIKERFHVENGFKYVLPFRFVSALRYAPRYVKELDYAMQGALKGMLPLKGSTGLLIDVSGSMDYKLSDKSEILRVDVAAGLGILVSGLAESSRVFTFSDKLVEVPPYSGLALIDTIKNSQTHWATHLGEAMKWLKGQTFDRLIVITDEQSHDKLPLPMPYKTYIINVGSYANGVGYNHGVTHIDGWSEKTIDFIQTIEREELDTSAS